MTGKFKESTGILTFAPDEACVCIYNSKIPSKGLFRGTNAA